jgi:hypothetical protein
MTRLSCNSRGVLLLVTMLAGAVLKGNAANIVADPGFESGMPNSYTGDMGDGWIVTAGTGAICNNDHSGCGNVGVSRAGAQMAFLDWSDSFNTIAQTLSTVIGQTYTISYWVSDFHPNFLEVAFGGSTLLDGTAPTSGDYVEYSFDATATSTSTVLAFSGQRTVGGGTLLDDVSVTASAVPEPSTWLLTSVALCGIHVFHRRRVRKATGFGSH